MGPLDLNTVPGFKEAQEAEQTARELAFISPTLPLCGIEVRQLTPRLWLLLNGLGCAFLKGITPGPEDIAMFFWFMSPKYSRDLAARDEFIKTEVIHLKFIETAQAIYAFLGNAFIDSPPATQASDQKSYWAHIGGLIHLIASAYGWDDEAIMDKPLARLFQYAKILRYSRNPKEPRFNASDRYVSQWLRDQNQGN